MTNPAGHLMLAHELVGQKNDEARMLFKGAAEFLGWTGTGPVIEGTIDNTTLEPAPRGTTLGMILAREFGEDAIYAKLKSKLTRKRIISRCGMKHRGNSHGDLALMNPIQEDNGTDLLQPLKLFHVTQCGVFTTNQTSRNLLNLRCMV